MGRDCNNVPVMMEFLASEPAFEEAPAARKDEDVVSGESRTYAQIVKDASFVETRQARERALEQKREEVREKKEKEQENRRKEKERRGRRGKGEDTSDEEGRRGFSIPRRKDWSEDINETELERDKKRAAGSPPGALPGSKAVKTNPRVPSQSRSRGQTPVAKDRGPGGH